MEFLEGGLVLGYFCAVVGVNYVFFAFFRYRF